MSVVSRLQRPLNGRTGRPSRVPISSSSIRRPAFTTVIGPLADATAAAIGDASGGGGLSPLAFAGGAAAVAAIGVAGARFAAYSSLELASAGMLTNWVPRAEPGAKVIQLGGGTRELYYYPKNALQVTVVGEGVNKSLLEQAGVQAAVPTLARAQPPWDLAFAPDASVDAVVSLRTLAGLTPNRRTAVLAEAARVLRPGGALVFVERCTAAAGGGAGAPPLRALVSGGGAAMDVNELERLAGGGGVWESVRYDTAVESLDPHAVGVAVRGSGQALPPSGGGGGASMRAAAREAAAADKRREKKASKPSAKGF